MSELSSPNADAPVVQRQAPVLLIPDVLTGDQCERLIAFWENTERTEGVVASATGDAAGVKRESKRRQDAFIPDGHPLVQEISAAVAARVGPEVLKAFQFRIEVMEGLRIGCYDAADQGFFRAHRDNTAPSTRHRRFAMSLNLNTGAYDGGALRFPEYGPALYVPPRGAAAIFSCALLHEALPVTRGRRFGLFSFFCSEADERARIAVQAGITRSG